MYSESGSVIAESVARSTVRSTAPLDDNNDAASSILSRKAFEDMKASTLHDNISEAGSEEDEVIPLDTLPLGEDLNDTSPLPGAPSVAASGSEMAEPMEGATPPRAPSVGAPRSELAEPLGGATPPRTSPPSDVAADAEMVGGDTDMAATPRSQASSVARSRARSHVSASGSRAGHASYAGRADETPDYDGDVDELQLLLSDTPLRKLKGKSEAAKSLEAAGDLWGAVRMRQECLALARIYFGVYKGAERGRHPMLLATAHFRLAQAYFKLGCYPQVGEHCSYAMEAMPQHGQYHDMVMAFRKDVNLLMGEALLMCEPPKCELALRHLSAAANVGSADQIEDPSVKVLAAQAYGIIGDAQLKQARSIRESILGMEDKLARAQEKIKGRSDRSGTYKTKMDALSNEISSEKANEQAALDSAKDAMDKAVDMLGDVAIEEQDKLKALLPEDDAWKNHPLMVNLFRRNAEMMLKLAIIEGLRGDTFTEMSHLSNIISLHKSYDWIPLSLVSTTLKEQGAVHVVRKDYDAALGCYNELMELQAKRYPNDVAKLSVSQGEAWKLLGNVYVAKKFYHKALMHYKEAHNLFSQYLGPDNGLAVDLEHRMSEIRASYMDKM